MRAANCSWRSTRMQFRARRRFSFPEVRAREAAGRRTRETGDAARVRPHPKRLRQRPPKRRTRLGLASCSRVGLDVLGHGSGQRKQTRPQAFQRFGPGHVGDFRLFVPRLCVDPEPQRSASGDRGLWLRQSRHRRESRETVDRLCRASGAGHVRRRRSQLQTRQEHGAHEGVQSRRRREQQAG